MSVRSHLELRQAEHDAMAKAMADFEASGGEIKRLPMGLMVDTDPNYDRKAAAAKKAAALIKPPTLPTPEPAPLRVPNAETFPQKSAVAKPKRGAGRATRRAAIAEAAAAVAPVKAGEPSPRDEKLSTWQRLVAAMKQGGNRFLYAGELRLITGCTSNNIGFTLHAHKTELERIGRRPWCQYRLRTP